MKQKDSKDWNRELQTWELFIQLYKFSFVNRRHREAKNDGTMQIDVGLTKSTDSQLVDKLLLQNGLLMEKVIVKMWLEGCFHCSEQYQVTKSEYEATRLDWKRIYQDNSFEKNDIDAKIKLKRSLNKIDEDYEDKISSITFELFKCGRIEEALEFLEKIGENVRLTSLKGLFLYSGIESDNDIIGNKNRKIWKKCCLRLSEEKSISTHERALYGVLSGNLNAVS